MIRLYVDKNEETATLVETDKEPVKLVSLHDPDKLCRSCALRGKCPDVGGFLGGKYIRHYRGCKATERDDRRPSIWVEA